MADVAYQRQHHYGVLRGGSHDVYTHAIAHQIQERCRWIHLEHLEIAINYRF